MDGRGVDAVILSSPRSLAHYAGVTPGDGKGPLLVVTAREARLVEPGDRAGEDAADIWGRAAALLPAGCALGYESHAMGDGALATLERAVRPRRMLCISADVGGQVDAGQQ